MSNPNTLDWLHYQDIQVPDATAKQEFDRLMNGGNYVEALKLLKDKQAQLKGKAYVSDTINKIMNGLLYLEDEYATNVTVFLSDLAAKYFALVDEFKQAGDWSVNLTYKPYNFVYYNKEVYLAIDDVPTGTLPTDDTYWVKYGLIGDKGAPGTGLKMKYQWQSGRQYTTSDIVAYKGDLYVAQKDNADVEPGTDEATWLTFLLVSKGKINVGVNPPPTPVQNTIWFKTAVDPLTATETGVGEMFRYHVNGDWEPMYPATFFTLIEDRDRYAPALYIRDLNIKPDQWGYLNGKYVVTYRDSKILLASLVDVLYGADMTEQEFEAYSNLSIEVKPGGVTFSTDYKPDVSIRLKLMIQ